MHISIGIVRHPVDRILAQWKTNNRFNGKDKIHGKLYNSTHASNYLLSQNEKDVRDGKSCAHFRQACHFVPQHEFVWNAQGRRTCEHVLTLDRLNDDFVDLMKLLG